MEEQKYKIKTEVFEGSLDLLLNLIEKRKLFINDISLAKITDEYIEYIKNNQNFSVGDSSNFVLVASTLILIKSKSLLPTLDLTLEEEKNIEDLEDRLKEYQKTRELSRYIEKMFGKNIIFSKSNSRSFEPIFSPDKKITLKNTFSSIREIINNFPVKEIIPKRVVKKVISLEETIQNLTKRIKSNIKMSFNEFSGIGKVEKINIVVSFLAMLELVKQGVVLVKQKDSFEDIDIENGEVGVPTY